MLGADSDDEPDESQQAHRDQILTFVDPERSVWGTRKKLKLAVATSAVMSPAVRPPTLAATATTMARASAPFVGPTLSLAAPSNPPRQMAAAPPIAAPIQASCRTSARSSMLRVDQRMESGETVFTFPQHFASGSQCPINERPLPSTARLRRGLDLGERTGQAGDEQGHDRPVAFEGLRRRIECDFQSVRAGKKHKVDCDTSVGQLGCAR